MQYRIGTVEFIQGSPVVTGSNTLWSLDNVRIGMQIHHRLYPLVPYVIADIDYNTQTITLSENYAAQSDPIAVYSVVSEYTPNLSIPEVDASDLDIAAILTRSLRKLDILIASSFTLIEAASDAEQDQAFATGAKFVFRKDISIGPPPETAPEFTTQPSAQTITATTVTLVYGWNDVNLDSARVDYSINNGSSWSTAKSSETPGEDKQFQITGLNAETQYLIKLRLVDLTGDGSTESSVVDITTQEVQSPPVFSVQAYVISNTDTSVLLGYSWSDANNDDARVEYSINNGSTWSTAKASESPGGGKTYQIDGLTQNTSYNLKLRLVDLTGDGTTTGNTVAVTTDETPLVQSALVRITSISSSNINVGVTLIIGVDIATRSTTPSIQGLSSNSINVGDTLTVSVA